MTQNNTGYQDLIINNGVLSAGANLVTSDTTGLQGLQMTNQFAICTNPGSNPVLVPCIAPMLLSPQTTLKAQIDNSNQENRSQNNNNHIHAMPQIQLANNFTIPANMAINPAGNLPLGLSYINLSSLTSQAGNATFPIQLALNTGSNQQITLPLASITQLTNDLQISNTYTITPQIKFEPEVNSADHMNQINDNMIQKNVIKTEQENTDDSIANNKRTRKKGVTRKNQYMKKLRIDDSNADLKTNQTNGDSEVLYDHKGRPFIYECNQCPKKFTQNSRLTAHLRCHSGIRPYTCTQCGFSFTQKSYLIRHAAVHKEDRPFTCAKCLKTYKHYGSLANHRKLHCRDGMMDPSGANGIANDGSNGIDDLDETIQRTIDSAVISNPNNLILAYTNPNTQQLQSDSLIYFSQNPTTAVNNSNNVSQTHTSSLNELHLPGSGPVVFPSHELTSLTAVSLLPTNQTAINELKSITTTNLATAIKNSSSAAANLVDTDEIAETSDGGHLNMSTEFHHIKQEPNYITVSLQVQPQPAQAEN